MKIRKSDNVMVLAGKDKGKTGVIDRVFVEEGKVTVKGIAMAKKHVKPSRKNPQGGIIDINLKVDVSNLALVCPSCGKPTRVGYKISENQKTRVCKKCNQSVQGRVE